MNRISAALTSLLLATPLAAETPDFDAYIAPFVKAGHLSGGLIVAEGDVPVYSRAFGYADYEGSWPVDTDTTFNIASVTKPITQIILMQVLEAGLISKDDPLSKYLPDFPRGDDITIEWLWNHRAGIAHQVVPEDKHKQRYTATDVAGLAASSEFTAEPGSEEAYSSGGYSVLARALEVATGKSYAQLLSTYVTGPADMIRTQDATEGVPGSAALPYLLGSDGWRVVPREDMSYLVGAGSIWSSPGDLLTLIRAFVKGQLGPEIRDTHLADGSIDWNGSAGGYRAFVQYDVATDRSVIFAGNLTSGAVEWLRANLLKVAAGENVEKPSLPTFTTTEHFNAEGLAGRYQLRPGVELPLRVEDDGIWIDTWVLIPTASGDLLSPQDYGVITPVRDESGAVIRLDWKRGDDVWPMQRVGD